MKKVSIENIEFVVTKITGITKEQIKIKTHKPEIAYPRQLVLSLAYFVFKSASVAKVAEYYNMDHSSVYPAKKSIVRYCTTYSEKREEVETVLSLLKDHVDIKDEQVKLNIRLFEKEIKPIKKQKYV